MKTNTVLGIVTMLILCSAGAYALNASDFQAVLYNASDSSRLNGSHTINLTYYDGTGATINSNQTLATLNYRGETSFPVDWTGVSYSDLLGAMEIELFVNGVSQGKVNATYGLRSFASWYAHDSGLLGGYTAAELVEPRWTVDDRWLHNISDTLTFNESFMNSTIDARGTDTNSMWSIDGRWLHNVSDILAFNESFINSTIDARDTNTPWIDGGDYIYLNSTYADNVMLYGNFTSNETNTIINIRSGDGQHLIKALNYSESGYTYFLPRGTYIINETIQIRKRGIKVVCSNNWATSIKANGTGFVGDALINTTGQEAFIENCRLDCNHVDGCSGITSHNTHNIYRDLHIYNFKDSAIKFGEASSSYYNEIHNLLTYTSIKHNGTYGVKFENNSHHNIIYGGRIWADTSIFINESASIRIHDTAIETNEANPNYSKGHGIEIVGGMSKDTVLDSLRFEGIHGYSIYFHDADTPGTPRLYTMGNRYASTTGKNLSISSDVEFVEIWKDSQFVNTNMTGNLTVDDNAIVRGTANIYGDVTMYTANTIYSNGYGIHLAGGVGENITAQPGEVVHQSRGSITFYGDTNQNGDIAYNNFGFYVNKTTLAMTIEQSGEVGIGTGSPASTLHVVGDTTVTEAVHIGTNTCIYENATGHTIIENPCSL